MKKITITFFALGLVFGSAVSVRAQEKHAKVEMSQADVKRLKDLSVQLAREQEALYTEAVRLAEINNWPLMIKKENGVSVLTQVIDGVPFYTSGNNAGSAVTSRTNHLQPGGSLGLNLTGEFSEEDLMAVGVWDEGYPLGNHQDLTGRTLPSDLSSMGVNLHPTHVTGTIIGNGSSAPSAKGMASKAFAYSYDYMADAGEMAAFASAGFILSNHSYGIAQDELPDDVAEQYRGSYIDLSKQVDQITFNAPYYQPVFAAGNDGDGFTYDRLTDRAASKNGIAVAAVYQVENYGNENDVQNTVFTSFGPTNDNRIKPDIATKGIQVYSCSNVSPTAHANDLGTSMAAPGITGSLVLLQQYYSILHPAATGSVRNFMKSATVRALVAHSADEAGFTPGPDPIYGWGLMNSKRAAEILAADSQNTSARIKELVLFPNDTYTYNVTALGTEPLVVTLAWTDPAGNTMLDVNTSVLVNNLDLKVKKGTVINYPWRLDSTGQAAENTADNNVDNIEKVEVPGASGQYTITVSHKKTTLKNPNGDPQQEYSLIVTGIQGDIVGLDDLKAKMFGVWPNPAGDVLNISLLNEIQKDAAVFIYDVQGRLVNTVKLTSVDNVIDVQGFAKGVYMVSVVNGNQSGVEKVVVK